MPGHVQHQVENAVLIETNRRATYMSRLGQSPRPLRPMAVWLFEQMHVHLRASDG
jgi:hypothetical protein